jgi:hypothetical protein
MYGQDIGPAPESLDGCGVLARMIDGLAFRYHWATAGLRSEDFGFRPGPDSMSTHELMEHVLSLVFMLKQGIQNGDARERLVTRDSTELRERTLEQLGQMREHLLGLGDATLSQHRVLKSDARLYPIWHIMNGPLADSLTHVGQINAWRRLNGNPPPRADVFFGSPPPA